MKRRLIRDGADASLIRGAEYIYLKDAGSMPVFKRAFTVREGLLSATLAVSALGVFAVWINGERLKDFIMAPGWTEYEKRIPYITAYNAEIINSCPENPIIRISL